jgi:hypothetical protein
MGDAGKEPGKRKQAGILGAVSLKKDKLKKRKDPDAPAKSSPFPSRIERPMPLQTFFRTAGCLWT